MLGNPLPGIIHPRGWARPSGNLDFVVTSTFSEHVASGRGPGIDMGNAHEGSAVLASAAGTITAAFIDPGNGAVIVRQSVDGAPNMMIGYAHMQKIETKVGIHVVRGIAIGHVGSTGAPGQPHLHWGVNVSGKEVDGWGLLDQNSGGDMIQGTTPTRILNRQTTVKAAATNFRSDPTTSKPALSQFGAGTAFIPNFSVGGQVVAGSGIWYSGFLPVNSLLTLGYFHESVLNPLSPSEASGGHTDAELAAAAAKAKTDGYNEGLVAVKSAAAAVPPK